MRSATPRRIRVGIAGMGAAGQAFVPALLAHPGFEWLAFAEPVESLRSRFQHTHHIAGYAGMAALLEHVGLDAVIVATPTPLHAAQVQAAARMRKHVLVEKPMAVALDDAHAMVAAADAAGVVLMVGHSHSFDAPISAMRQVITSGEIGRVRMVHNWCFSDWVNRPRRPDELDAGQGGGVTFRQGSHQFDVIRYLCGGRARSVRAKTFDCNPQRPTTGAHTVFIDFEDGPAATAVYNGYGGFSSMDLCFDISEWGLHQPPAQRSRAPPTAGVTAAQELLAKQARAAGAISATAPHPPMFGLTLVSCERGDIRQSAHGLQVHTRVGMREVPVSSQRSPRELVLDELHAAITAHQPATHSGRWGLANLELCTAAIESSRTAREVTLRWQVALVD